MIKEQNSSLANDSQDKQQLTQTIIDEMNAQGFLDGFIDRETGLTSKSLCSGINISQSKQEEFYIRNTS